MEAGITGLLTYLSALIESSGWIAPLLALIAGIVSSFSPCSLSGVPLVIGYVSGYGGRDTKVALRLSLVFAAGMAVTFTALGAMAAILGKLMQGTGSWWYILLGLLMMLMALQVWEIFTVIPSTYAVSKNTRRGYVGALIAGFLAGLFSSPCTTPVLIVLLAIVLEKGSLIWGLWLLLFYSIGHCTLAVIAGTSVGFVRRLLASERYGKSSRILRVLLGLFMAVIALYMFYLGF